MNLVRGRVMVCGSTGANDTKASKQDVVPSIPDNGSQYRSGPSSCLRPEARRIAADVVKLPELLCK